MKTVSIGIMRDDGDFAVLATLNNNDEHLTQPEFDRLVSDTVNFLNERITDVVQAVERQDAPDYVDLSDVEDYCYHCGYYHENPSSGGGPDKGCADYEQTTQE